MEALSGLTAFAWLIITLLWLLTFVPPARRLMARTVLAPLRIPLRRARWALAISATSLFVFTAVVMPTKDSGNVAAVKTREAVASVHKVAVPKGWVVIPKGKWALMEFAHTGSYATGNLRLDKTRREVVGFADDSTYDSRAECEKALRRFQQGPSEEEVVRETQPWNARLIAAVHVVDEDTMTAICEESDGSARFAVEPMPGP